MINFFIENHLKKISDSFIGLDVKKLNILINLIGNTKNNIFFTGIGKNGHVMEKASSTFNSMGIKTYFINPVDAVHGDMGKVGNGDLIIALSKSGNTDELLNFLYHVSKITKNIFLIHSNKDNKCLEFSNDNLFIEITGEADHLNTIPTVSIAVYTILMQSISCEIGSNNNLTIPEFVKNHPGGSLGKLK
jgi:arabinose-5-phosphate isomerase